jgi:23S rRNA (cytidine1920-2'-O)/16S rRNA (cytidine1409-2'-O)-methyltransferase
MLILTGKVRLENGVLLSRPAQVLASEIFLSLDSAAKFVSRGGEKLEAFLETFSVDVSGRYALDVGASTGGFADCLLRHGVASVTCVDVGHGQLHPRLRRDVRIRNLEGLHAGDISTDLVGARPFELICVDLSFISLRKVLPVLWRFLAEGGILIALIKPQFEAGRSIMARCRGVLRDAILQENLRDSLVSFALQHLDGSCLLGLMDSPLRGTRGNREFLMGLKKREWQRDRSAGESTGVGEL